jgi:hypothetical protein
MSGPSLSGYIQPGRVSCRFNLVDLSFRRTSFEASINSAPNIGQCHIVENHGTAAPIAYNIHFEASGGCQKGIIERKILVQYPIAIASDYCII